MCLDSTQQADCKCKLVLTTPQPRLPLQLPQKMTFLNFNPSRELP